MPTTGHTVAYGDWLGARPDKLTVPIYGHLTTFSPLLNPAGNSVRGQLVARYLAQGLSRDFPSSEPNTAHNSGKKYQPNEEESPDE